MCHCKKKKKQNVISGQMVFVNIASHRQYAMQIQDRSSIFYLFIFFFDEWIY